MFCTTNCNEKLQTKNFYLFGKKFGYSKIVENCELKSKNVEKIEIYEEFYKKKITFSLLIYNEFDENLK